MSKKIMGLLAVSLVAAVSCPALTLAADGRGNYRGSDRDGDYGYYRDTDEDYGRYYNDRGRNNYYGNDYDNNYNRSNYGRTTVKKNTRYYNDYNYNYGYNYGNNCNYGSGCGYAYNYSYSYGYGYNPAPGATNYTRVNCSYCNQYYGYSYSRY